MKKLLTKPYLKSLVKECINEQEDIETFLLKQKKPTTTFSIDKFIQYLQKEKSKGADKIALIGYATLISNKGNTVIISTEHKMQGFRYTNGDKNGI